MPKTDLQGAVSLSVENVGGIDRTEVAFDPGVTVLAGRNATHRTSLLQAIMAALGSTDVSLKGDAEEGRVRMAVGDDVYTRTLTRTGSGVSFDGDPYLDDPQLADLFAFLLESNEARRTVAVDGDLREVIMDPVDADAIQAEVRNRTAEKRSVMEEIEELESLKERLPGLEQERTQLERDIEEKRAELAAKQAALEEKSTDASEAKAEQSELDTKMDELRETRSDLENVEFRLESQRDSLATLKEERDSLEESKADLTVDEGDADLDHIESEIKRLREQKQALASELSKLQNVIQFNEKMLDGASEDIAAALRDDEPGTGDLTEQLLDPDETVACWTCGTEVERDRIESTLDRLRDLRETKHGERTDIESQIEDLTQRRDDIEAKRAERRRVTQRLSDVEEEIAERETKIEELEAEREALSEEIATLESDIEALEAEDRSEVLDVHREVNQLEIELERLEDEHDNVEEEIAEIEERTNEIDVLRERKETLQAEITDLRTRIEQIETDVVEEFNEHMAAVLDILEYDNIDRIWIERVERTVTEGRRKVSKGKFDLHVVRSNDEGVTYEDELEHLSESEREVTGLVFALAGYLVHEVHEELPFIVLDSLEAIDSTRIANLVDYLRDYADYLVIALLTEDADALSSSYQRIESIV